MRTETYRGIPFVPEQDGPYRLVQVFQSLQRPGQVERIWWDDQRSAKVREVMGRDHELFTFIYVDFDGTVVQSEQQGNFFDVSWAMLFREYGISGTTEQLAHLKKHVYLWRNDVGASTLDMLQRVENGRDVNGNILTPEVVGILQKLIRAYPQDDLKTIASILADRKENLGAAIVLNNPKIVEQLAPLTPGFIDFLHALPEDLPIAIGSASRRRTIIEPILTAHDRLHPEFQLMRRIKGFIVGEENSCGTAKPDDKFFDQMRWVSAHQLHRSGFKYNGRVFHVEDALFIGDKAIIDVPAKRSMHHLIVNPHDCTESYGPMTAVIPDFPALLAIARKPGARVFRNSTLQRIARTLRQ